MQYTYKENGELIPKTAVQPNPSTQTQSQPQPNADDISHSKSRSVVLPNTNGLPNAPHHQPTMNSKSVKRKNSLQDASEVPIVTILNGKNHSTMRFTLDPLAPASAFLSHPPALCVVPLSYHLLPHSFLRVCSGEYDTQSIVDESQSRQFNSVR
jgi:hypothetical protein